MLLSLPVQSQEIVPGFPTKSSQEAPIGTLSAICSDGTLVFVVGYEARNEFYLQDQTLFSVVLILPGVAHSIFVLGSDGKVRNYRSIEAAKRDYPDSVCGAAKAILDQRKTF